MVYEIRGPSGTVRGGILMVGGLGAVGCHLHNLFSEFTDFSQLSVWMMEVASEYPFYMYSNT